MGEYRLNIWDHLNPLALESTVFWTLPGELVGGDEGCLKLQLYFHPAAAHVSTNQLHPQSLYADNSSNASRTSVGSNSRATKT